MVARGPDAEAGPRQTHRGTIPMNDSQHRQAVSDARRDLVAGLTLDKIYLQAEPLDQRDTYRRPVWIERWLMLAADRLTELGIPATRWEK